MNKEIKVSVRDMVEFTTRSGDIIDTYISKGRGQDGIRLHGKVQRMRKKEAKLENFIYESEYTLKYEFKYKDCDFIIQGRADGIFIKEDEITIEEIKSTNKNVLKIDRDLNHWHMAQGKCYGYIYMKKHNLSKISILLTYINVESEDIINFREEYTLEELEGFFFEIIDKYYDFAYTDLKWQEKRDISIKKLDFPFEKYRLGQREMAIGVYAGIKNEKSLFSKAPTGERVIIVMGAINVLKSRVSGTLVNIIHALLRVIKA